MFLNMNSMDNFFNADWSISYMIQFMVWAEKFGTAEVAYINKVFFLDRRVREHPKT